MLNLNCVICTELFSPSDDVHVTSCGHLFHYVCISQWLARAKSCPQCRNKCTDRSIVRVYFNLANLDVSRIDIAGLQEQLDNVKLQLQLGKTKLKEAETENKSLQELQRHCMMTIKNLEEKLQKKELVIYSYITQMKLLKAEVKGVNDLQAENKTLKKQVETMENVAAMMTASKLETEKMLSTEKDPKTLATYVTALKRELHSCETKRIDQRNFLRMVQKKLDAETKQNKQLLERISLLESENYQLTEKVKELEAPNLKPAQPEKPSSSLQALLREERRTTISPITKDILKKIENSDSPYFNIKSSSIGLAPFLSLTKEAPRRAMSGVSITATTDKKSPRSKGSNPTHSLPRTGTIRKVSSDLSEKYSIFKKPRVGLSAATLNISSANATKYVSNGFGGLERIDPFAEQLGDLDERTSTEILNRRINL